MKIITKNKEQFKFLPLAKSDGELLSNFFENLSLETKGKFGPHPLTREFVNSELCNKIGADNVQRFVVKSTDKIIGYFIVDSNEYPHERTRYATYQIDLDFSLDPVLAPCVADEYQNQGVASQAMKILIKQLKQTEIRSLVLMGGTQGPNHLARNFYRKFGFQELGAFYTEHNDLNNFDMRLVL